MSTQNKVKKKRTRERGPDKQPRNHGGGMPAKAEDEKATFRNVALLTAAQDAEVVKLFGTAKKALLWAIENYKKEEPII